jgi:dTDP-4-dehydrorhamnose 3,5-epimerase
MTLRFTACKIPGVVVIEPEVNTDDRGFLLETYHAAKYREGGIDATFVQDNHSSSSRGTLRGLHGQSPHAQGKLVRVLEGEIFDVHLRTASSLLRPFRVRTFGRSTRRPVWFTDSWS